MAKKQIVDSQELVTLGREEWDELLGFIDQAASELQVAAEFHDQQASVDTRGGILETARQGHGRQARADRVAAAWLEDFWKAHRNE